MIGCMQIILLTDADVDGAHIRTLLLTFLYRYSRDVFSTGNVYVGVPPLYKLDIGRKSQYCYDEGELQREIKGRAPGSYQIQRFKVGLAVHHSATVLLPPTILMVQVLQALKSLQNKQDAQ